MKPALLFITLLAMPALAAPAPKPAAKSDPVPRPVAEMLRIAVDSGDPVLAARTEQMAKSANPTAAVAIDALYKTLLDTAEKRRREALIKQRYYQGWKGKAEFGGIDTTGTDNSTGVTANLSLVRDGLRWKQAFTAAVDYLHDNGVEERDRYFAGQQTNYKFNDRLYALGLVSWEGNRAQGFDSRFSASLGAGLTVIHSPHMGLSVEASPAVRSTEYLGAMGDTSFAARVAGNYHWDVTPRVTVSEDATYYRESDDHTLTSEAAMTVKLIGALATKFSYRVQREEKNLPLPAANSDDTTSRVSLVYTF